MEIQIGLSPAQREGVLKVLRSLLADEYVLYTKTRNFHWNVVGPQFSELHKFFESQYEALDDIIDEVAERSRALGGHAIGTLAEMKEFSSLPEDPGVYPVAPDMIKLLLADHENIVRSVRGEIPRVQDEHGDIGTADFLTGLMEQHEKMAWMLRAHRAA